MAEIATFRKNKIELSEYEYEKDVLNRTLMSEFTPLDVAVLEEILYSSLRIPLSVLEQNLDLSRSELNSILEKLSKTQLFKVAMDHVIVDKEMRKYYEQQVLKFEEDFKPGMEYLQGLLRKVPIHVLPSWYSISRTSNNIFESIVEKYLQTPQVFQRYLMDLNLTDPVHMGILNAVYQSPDYEVNASDIIKKYNLTREKFEEHMLFLEFSFVCCTRYIQEEDLYREIITPFQEWYEYLSYVRDTESLSIIDEELIQRVKPKDFSVIEEMSMMVQLAQENLLTRMAIPTIQKKYPEFHKNDFESYAEKLLHLNLIEKSGDKFLCTTDGIEWIKIKEMERALYLYRHPRNGISNRQLPEELCNPRLVREAEKSVSRLVGLGWVFWDDFFKGIFIPLKETHMITLKHQGRVWKYILPQYTEIEKKFFREVIQTWLFELGMVALGKKEGRECFCLTPLGQDLFSNE